MKHRGRIGLVRHGQTFANVDKVWHGHTDTKLTPHGYQQIDQLGAYFHNYMRPDVIYASPLQRAMLTAEAIAGKYAITIEQDPRLMEFDLGDWEGASFQSLNGSQKILEQLVKNPSFTAPNGESQQSVKERIVSAIEDIVTKHADQNIVIVAHGVTLAIALSHYIEGDTTQWSQYSKDNTAFSEICLNSMTLISYNKTEHLETADSQK